MKLHSRTTKAGTRTDALLAPLRKIVGRTQYLKRLPILPGKTGHHSDQPELGRTWDFTLECGHVVTRLASRVRETTTAVRCEQCLTVKIHAACRLCNRQIQAGEYCPRCAPPEGNSIPDGGATCQEASIMSRQVYIACGMPATAIVHHAKDRRSYFMCGPCADHNVRNRGGELRFDNRGWRGERL